MTPHYMTVNQAAAYLAFPSYRACWIWMKRHGIPMEHLGGRVLVLKASLDEAVKRGRKRRLKAVA